MASYSNAGAPPRRQSAAAADGLTIYASAPEAHKGNADADSELSLSLNNLSLSTSSSSNQARKPSSPTIALRPSLNRSPSSASNRGAPRSPLHGPSALNSRDSRASTPSLLKKTSSSSLRSSSGATPAHRRASAANMFSPSLKSPTNGYGAHVERAEKPPLTANSVANAHFKAELDALHSDHSATPADAVVILHDSCYGHRYSRPRTSRAALSTIVERPERIRASVLGVSAAYVRLGERHAEGAYPIHPKVEPAKLPSIPFRIRKTARRVPLLSPAVTNVHGTKWMEELRIMCDSAEAKLAMNGKELQRPEMDRGPDGETPDKFHEGDLYLCAESLEALEGSLGGVCEAVDAVFELAGPKRAFCAIRPPGHHCSDTWPSGFCWINNVHVGIMHGILNHGLTHAAIIDFDLHHGDGSQAITWAHNSREVASAKNAAWWKKTSIGYFSLHDINSYPCEMGDEEKVRSASICIDNAHGQNVWNVHLEPWKSEDEFWQLYETKYMVLLEKTRKFLKLQTERQRSRGAIFISAGFDASEWEGQGMQRHKVSVPTEFYARITRDITKIADEEGLGIKGRVVSVLEGGYSDRALCSGVLSHISGLAGEDPITTHEANYDDGRLGSEMGQRFSSSHGRQESLSVKKPLVSYDAAWWSKSELERLEAAMAGPPPEPKAPRYVTPPTYSSPTTSSQAKVVATPKLRRSTSGMSLNHGNSPAARAPTPPPPDVPWTVAAYELSKLLIPSEERQTMSCRPEDLAAEATRARKMRQAALMQSTAAPDSAPPTPGGTTGGPKRVSQRERKQVKPFGAITQEEEEHKNRRRTTGSSVLLSEKATTSRSGTPSGAGRPTLPNRRLSAASTIVAATTELEIPLPTTEITRPATSAGGRPSTAMSVKAGTGSTLNVKKTRAPAAARKEAVKAPRGPKKTQVPAASAPKFPTAATTSTSSSVQQRESDDMEKLTSGMKKVKINIITPAQREARERAKKEEGQVKASSAATNPAKQESTSLQPLQPQQVLTPAAEGFSVTQTPSEAIEFTPAVATPIEAPYLPESPRRSPRRSPDTPQNGSRMHNGVSVSEAAQRMPLPASSPAWPSTPSATPAAAPGAISFVIEDPSAAAAAAAPSVFVPYQPEGLTPAAIPQSQPLQWMPVNAPATPSPMKRGDLPIFTATSSIPFATSTSASAASPLRSIEVKLEQEHPGRKQEDDEGDVTDIWAVPETPRK